MDCIPADLHGSAARRSAGDAKETSNGRSSIRAPLLSNNRCARLRRNRQRHRRYVSEPYMGFNLVRHVSVTTGPATPAIYFEIAARAADEGLQVQRRLFSRFKHYRNRQGAARHDRPAIDHYLPLLRSVSSVFGAGKQVAMEDFGRGLSDLIIKLRDRICVDDADKTSFKVYLVGHSMGGLVIRCFCRTTKSEILSPGNVSTRFSHTQRHTTVLSWKSLAMCLPSSPPKVPIISTASACATISGFLSGQKR